MTRLDLAWRQSAWRPTPEFGVESPFVERLQYADLLLCAALAGSICVLNETRRLSRWAEHLLG